MKNCSLDIEMFCHWKLGVFGEWIALIEHFRTSRREIKITEKERVMKRFTELSRCSRQMGFLIRFYSTDWLFVVNTYCHKRSLVVLHREGLVGSRGLVKFCRRYWVVGDSC